MGGRNTILIVDDDRVNLSILQELLSDDYRLLTAENGLQAIAVAKQNIPDLILMDITMPELDGINACAQLKASAETKDIPVIFLTALGSIMDETRGFDVGAVDYIHKPISFPIVLRRIKTHLSLVRAEKLDMLARESIHMLGEAGHYNDTDTGVHIWRMADYSATIARAAGWDRYESDILELAAPMHDTGKIGIPDSILKAERDLTENEWITMRQHSRMGYEILSRSDHAVFKLAATIALCHHEKWNGSGYPDGLRGEDIPEVARIVAVADVFDALTMKRPYKEEWSIEDAISYIRKESGHHFEPRLVELFMDIKKNILQVKAHWDKKDHNNESGFD